MFYSRTSAHPSSSCSGPLSFTCMDYINRTTVLSHFQLNTAYKEPKKDQRKGEKVFLVIYMLNFLQSSLITLQINFPLTPLQRDCLPLAASTKASTTFKAAAWMALCLHPCVPLVSPMSGTSFPAARSGSCHIMALYYPPIPLS